MIAPDDQSAEIRVLAAVDAAFAAARELAGEWLACHAGCDECCRRPFAITEQDAVRLRRGLALLDPAIQADIAERAGEARQRMAFDFPGEDGALTAQNEWREWFFQRYTGLPCPVLDLDTGECRLYEHRPVACRLAGPLIQIGVTTTDPCRLCFGGANPEEVNATKIVVDLPDFYQSSVQPETLVAFAL